MTIQSTGLSGNKKCEQFKILLILSKFLVFRGQKNLVYKGNQGII